MKKVLVVDDYREGAFITRRLLEAFGHEVAEAYSGPSAIEKAGAWQPDVILMDINMPNMDGYEACAAMRKLPALQKTMIFALTGIEDSEVRRLAAEAGFDDIILKAEDWNELNRKVEEAGG